LALSAMKISIASSSTPARPMVWLRLRESQSLSWALQP
jgi:hypothetical protein